MNIFIKRKTNTTIQMFSMEAKYKDKKEDTSQIYARKIT
jgi:hypothetical protein